MKEPLIRITGVANWCSVRLWKDDDRVSSSYFFCNVEINEEREKMQTLRLISNLEVWGISENFRNVRIVTVENGGV